MSFDIAFLTGVVVSIDVFRKFSGGVIVPVVKVQSNLDSTFIDIPWLPIGADQSMPMPGNECLYFTAQSRNPHIVCFWGNNGANVRKGAYGLNEGEAMIQSDSGLGYLKCSNDGSVELTTGDSVVDLLMNGDGVAWTSPAFTLSTYAGAVFSIAEDSTISLSRASSSGTIQAELVLDANNNASVTALGNVTIKAPNIYLDGNVAFGPGASDPTKVAMFGLAVTAGPGGTYPFDLLSGAPIPGSSTVKIAR